MTVSGVFSAWARLPAWRRASSACASLCASSCVDLLGQRADLAREVLARSGSARPSGSRRPRGAPGAAATGRRRPAARRARAGRAPSTAKLQIRVVRSSLIWSSMISRDCATWKRQRTREPGRIDVALDDAQRLAGEFAAVVGVDVDVVVAAVDAQPPVPQRARREGVGALAADLEIDARIGLEEALVGGRAVEADLAVRADLRRGDHRVEDIFELVVEIARRSSVVSTRSSAKPPSSSRTAIHSAATPIIRRVSDPMPRRLGGRRSRRRHRGGRLVQAGTSSRL